MSQKSFDDQIMEQLFFTLDQMRGPRLRQAATCALSGYQEGCLWINVCSGPQKHNTVAPSISGEE